MTNTAQITDAVVDDIPPEWQVEIWPNRSLTKRGAQRFLLFLAGCFAFFGTMTVFAPTYEGSRSVQLQVFAVICAAMAIVLFGMWLAFRRSNQDGTYRERLRIAAGTLTIEAEHPRRALRRWDFPTYWTDVKTRNTREVEHQIILTHAGKAVAVGAFLTPEERLSLASEIRSALARFG